MQLISELWLVAQMVRVLSQYSTVAGQIPGQGNYRNQLMNSQIIGRANQCFSLSFPLCLSKKIN